MCDVRSSNRSKYYLEQFCFFLKHNWNYLMNVKNELYSTVFQSIFFILFIGTILRPKKKIVMLPSPDQNLKIGSVERIFFFFFFLRTVRELSFPIFFLKFLNGENSGGMQSKRIYKCFFKPLNTNFSKFFAQIWHFQKNKKKQNDPVFSHFTVGRERAT